MTKKINTLFIILILISNISYAQDRKGKMGFVFMEDFITKPLNYGFSLWINNNTSLEIIGGFEKMNLKDNSGILYNIGLGGLYHFGTRKIVPFVGARLLSANLSNNKESYTDLVLGLVFGAEYNFSDWISLAGEFQLNYIETDKEYSPTGNATSANIYKTGRFIILRFYL